MFIFLLFMASVNGLELSPAKTVLQRDLEYLKTLFDPDGSGQSNSLRALAVVGLFAVNIHLGLGDAESLRLIDRIADRIYERVSKGDGIDLGFSGKVDPAENLFTHLSVGSFSAAHYGLTKNIRGKETLQRIGQSIEDTFGWNPVNSKAGLMIQSAKISVTAGGTPAKQDIEEAVDSFYEKFDAIIAYSTRSPSQLIQSLSALSNLLIGAANADVDVPEQLIALWRVHIDYAVNYTVDTSRVSASRLFNALVDAAENVNDPYSTYAREAAVKLAEKLRNVYRVADRILLQETTLADLLVYDPAVSAGEISAAIRGQTRVAAVDVVYPSALARLRKIVEIEEETLQITVSRLSTSEGFYPLVEKGVVKSEEFVNRFLRSSVLGVILASERAPSAKLRNTVVEQLVSAYPVSIAVSTLLVLLAVLNKVGVLYKQG